jgi:hypothetical protein
MKRRGIFRGFGAALAAAAAAKTTPPAATDAFMARPVAVASLGRGFVGGAVGSEFTPSPEYLAALRAIGQAEERQRQLVHMLGGYPPHLVSMHSTATWWRAQRAMAWQKREAEKSEGLLRDLQRAVSAKTPSEAARGILNAASAVGLRG